MRGLNKAYLIGHIGQDPELRATPGGAQVMKLSLATQSARKVGNEWVETPDWHKLTFWDKDAEFIAKYAHKGDVLAVECALKTNKWTDKEGHPRSTVDLKVERILWLNGARRGAAADTPQAVTPPPPSPAGEPDVDGIPF